MAGDGGPRHPEPLGALEQERLCQQPAFAQCAAAILQHPDHRRTTQAVVVIQNQNKPSGNGHDDLIDKHTYHARRATSKVGAGGERAQGLGTEPREAMLDRGNKALKEHAWVAVTGIEGVPAHGVFQIGRKVHEERGLAIARRCRDQRQPVVHHIIESVE